MTTPHHQPTHPLRNTSLCCLQSYSWAVRTTGFCSHRRPLPTQRPSVLGREGPTTGPWQALPLAESVLELWQVMEPLVSFLDEEVLKDALSSNWWRSVCPDWQNQLCPDCQNQVHETIAVAEATGPAPGGSCEWPMTRDDQYYKPLPLLR